MQCIAQNGDYYAAENSSLLIEGNQISKLLNLIGSASQCHFIERIIMVAMSKVCKTWSYKTFLNQNH